MKNIIYQANILLGGTKELLTIFNNEKNIWKIRIESMTFSLTFYFSSQAK